jgi:hypothetical protein
MKNIVGFLVIIIGILFMSFVSFGMGYSLGDQKPAKIIPVNNTVVETKYVLTGSTNNAQLITYINMKTPPMYNFVPDQKVFILGENTNNKNQYMVYLLETCGFGYIEKSQIVLDPQ